MITGKRQYPKKNRLTQPTEYRNVFTTNLRSVDSCFIVLAKENGLEFSRLGIAVSKKKIKKAIKRNKIKRIIRESFRQDSIKQEHYDLIVLPQLGHEKAEEKKLRDSLNEHWRKITKCGSS